jgi:hypothetical protein
VTLDIDKSAVTGEGETQAVGTKQSDYLNVIIDDSAINLTAPAEEEDGDN